MDFKDLRRENIEDVYPVSYIQLGMIYHSLKDPETAVYHIQSVVQRKDKDFKPEILKKALVLMIEKHPILRTGFILHGYKEPLLVVFKKIKPDIRHYDLSHMDETRQEEHIESFLGKDRKRPFNFEHPEPVWRVRTFAIDNENICFLWICHHAITDGWSSASLMTELNNTYVRLKSDPHYVPKKLENTYKQFVLEERLARKSKTFIEYWQKELYGYKRLRFPGVGNDESKFAMKKKCLRHLGSELREKLTGASKKYDISFKNLCFAVYVYILSMLSYDNDIVVGLVTHNRPLCEDGDKILGCFLNTVPVRIKIPDGMKWSDYIAVVNKKAQELMNYNRVSLTEIAKIIGEETLDRNPIYNTLFNFIDFHVYSQVKQINENDGEGNDKRLSLKGNEVTNTIIDCEVSVTMGEFAVGFNYSSLLIKDEFVENLTIYFERALNKLVHEPESIVNIEKQKNSIGQGKEYWLREFEGEIPVLNLPVDYRKPRSESFEGRTAAFDTGLEESAGLKSLALQEDTSLFMVLLCIYNVLLWKVTAQEDIIVGTTTTGLFLNTLALRNYPKGDKTFREFLNDVKNKVLQAFENREFPFEDLVEELGPLFNTMFQLENTSVPGVSGFDIALFALDREEKLFYRVEYNAKLFRDKTIEIFIKYFKEIVSAVLSGPGNKLSEIKKMPEERRQGLLFQLNRGLKDEVNLINLDGNAIQIRLNKALNRFRYKTAVEYGSKVVTYDELDKRSNYIANWILNKGIKKETFIGAAMDDRYEVISALIGVLKAGCVFVPLDPAYPETRLEVMAHTAGINIIISDKINFSRFAANDGDVILIDRLFLSGKPSWFFMRPDLQYSPGDKIYIYFTSGTTGKPKAIVGRNIGLLHFIDWEINTFEAAENIRISQFTTPCFDAFLRDVFAPLCSGGVICIPENRDIVRNSHELIQWIDRSRVNLIHCVPGLFRSFNSDGLTGNNFKNLKFIILSGERIDPSDLEYWYKIFSDRIKLVNLWGTSETTLAKTYYFIKAADINRIRIPVGKPITGARVVVLDEGMNPCDRLVRGELFIKTPFRTAGYYNEPELNRERFPQDPFSNEADDLLHKTGDLGRILGDGNIDVLGRNDRQVKIRGIRLELEEIESVLQDHPQVEEAVVLKKELDTHNELLAAYIVEKKSNGEADGSLIDILKKHLAERLPDYMIPGLVNTIKEIPRAPNGKIDFAVLTAYDVGKQQYIPPQNDVQRKLVQLWSEMLKIEKIGIMDNFFVLGGNSLNVMNLISRIHRDFDVRVPLADIFNNPTIEQLAELIVEEEEEKFASIEPEERKEYYPLSSAQKRFYILQQLDLESTAYVNSTVLILEGRFDKERFEDAFNKLINRHESLRTSFELLERETVQELHEEINFAVEYYELPEAGLEKIIAGFTRAFDLAEVPIVRVGLIKLEPQKHILMYNMHHIITDGTSMRIFVKDLLAFYLGEELLPLRLQYKDFSQWQNDLLTSGKLKKQEEYWLEQFSGEIPVLNMPTDYARPTVQNFEGDVIAFSFGEELSRQLKVLMEETGTTLYMMALALYNILLSKFSGQKDIIVGSPTAGRFHADLENIIGLFIETILVRSYPGGDKTFEEFLQEVKESTLKAYENRGYPFGELIKHTGYLHRLDGSRNPLFDAMLIVQNVDTGPGDSPIEELRVLPYGGGAHRTAKVDLTLEVTEGEETIFFNLEYCTKLFKRETMEAFIASFKEIAAAAVNSRKIKLKDIEISHDLGVAIANVYDEVESEFQF